MAKTINKSRPTIWMFLDESNWMCQCEHTCWGSHIDKCSRCGAKQPRHTAARVKEFSAALSAEYIAYKASIGKDCEHGIIVPNGGGFLCEECHEQFATYPDRGYDE